jgi:hypothetical protein
MPCSTHQIRFTAIGLRSNFRFSCDQQNIETRLFIFFPWQIFEHFQKSTTEDAAGEEGKKEVPPPMQPSSHAIAMPRPVKKKTCALASEIVCC